MIRPATEAGWVARSTVIHDSPAGVWIWSQESRPTVRSNQIVDNALLFRGPAGGLPSWFVAWLMLLGQSVFNFFVTSGSGQAALTILGPGVDRTDLSGILKL